VCPNSSSTQKLKCCHLPFITVSLTCFKLKDVGKFVEVCGIMCRWHDQLVGLGKRIDLQVLENEFNKRSQSRFAGSVLSV
jgi:hypothetical protein